MAASRLIADSSGTWFGSLRNLTDTQLLLEPLWQLVQLSLPWLPLAIFGQWCTRHDAFAGNYSRERLLACWSISVPIAVFLLTPSRMEFALAAAGAWSISAAIGVERLVGRVFKELPILETRHNRALFQKFLTGCAAVLTLTTVWSDFGGNSNQVDQQLLAEARAMARNGQPLLVDLNLGDQAAVILFELDDQAEPLQLPAKSQLWENAFVISTETFQRDALDQGYVSRVETSRPDPDVIMVRMNRFVRSDVPQIASESVRTMH